MALVPGDLAGRIPDRTVRRRLSAEDLVRYVLVAVFALVLFLFVLYPMGQLAWRSLLDNQGRFVGAANYARYFGTPAIASSITNSLHVSVVSMVVTVLLAFAYAYALTRTLMPWQGLFRLVAMLPLFAPSLVQALAFIHVFGNNGILTRTTGSQYRHLWRQGHHLRGGLLLLSPRPADPDRGPLRHRRAAVRRRAERSAPRRSRPFCTVTLPGREVRPRERVLRGLHPRHHGLRRPQGHRRQVLGDGHRDLQPGLGPAELHHGRDGVGRAADPRRAGLCRRPHRAAAAVRARDLVVQAARAAAPAARRLGGFAYCALIAAAIGGLYLTILVYSLVARWPYNFTPTLKHYAFDTVGGYAPIWNSVYVAAWTAIVGTALTFVGAYVVEKCRTAASGPLYLLSILPVSIPGMVLGLAYIFTFNAPGSVLNLLYGTLAILVVSNVIHYFTVGFLTATTALKQMDAEFENVSASLGVPFYTTFWRVTVPMALPADRRHQHVLLPERDGDAVRRGVSGGAGHRAGRGGRAPDGRRGRQRAGRRHVGAHHRGRARRPARLLGAHARRDPAHAGMARRRLKRAHLRRYGALGSTLNVERLRLALPAIGRRLASGPFEPPAGFSANCYERTMMATVVDIGRFRGRFFEVLQETTLSQTAVMTIGPGQDAGPEETHAGDQVVYVVEGEAVLRDRRRQSIVPRAAAVC